MKKTVVFLTAVLFAAELFAQTSDALQQEEAIELPEVTTVVSGESIKAGKEAVPDYKEILPDTSSSELELPEMNQVNTQNVPQSSFKVLSPWKKTVFAEGRIGGGFPFNFLGDFSIYRSLGNAPFSINFYHESFEGFGNKNPENGFFERNTEVDAVKEFLSQKNRNKFSGRYKMTDRGLQSKSESCTDTVYHSIAGKYEGDWFFTNGMFFNVKAGGDFYNRYGTTYKGALPPADSWEKSANILSLNPGLGFGWNNNGFRIAFNTNYDTSLNLKKSETLEKAHGSSSKESSHRVEFKIDSSWENSSFKIWGNAAAVTGTAAGSNPVIVPFTLGIHYKFSADGNNVPALFAVEGGCISAQNTIGKIESMYSYTSCPAIPVESTDWYGTVRLVVPVKDLVRLNIDGNFYKTAFDKGIWAPDYEGAIAKSGFYMAEQKNRTDLNTKIAGTVNLGQVKFYSEWKAFWIDVPVLEKKHTITASAMYLSKDASWNIEAYVKQAVDSDDDKVPDLGISGAVRVSNSMRLALDVKDVIKLCTNKTRTFAHSVYKEKSGNLSALVKFQF